MTDPQQPRLPLAPPVFDVGFIDLGPGNTGPDGVLGPPSGPLSLTNDPPLAAPAITPVPPSAPSDSAAPASQPATWTDPAYPGVLFTHG